MISTTLTLQREDDDLHVAWNGDSDEAVARLRVRLHLPSGAGALVDESHPDGGVDSWDLSASSDVGGRGVLVTYEITTTNGDAHHGQLALPRSSKSDSRRFEHSA